LIVSEKYTKNIYVGYVLTHEMMTILLRVRVFANIKRNKTHTPNVVDARAQKSDA